jgi:putative transposase
LSIVLATLYIGLHVGRRHQPHFVAHSSPEVIRLVVMMYVRFPLSLLNVEDLLFERGIDICHETVRQWWNRFGPMFAADIRRQRISRMRGFRQWRWHLDEMYVKLNGEMVYLWRAVDHEGEAYAEMRRGLAKKIGLGRKPGTKVATKSAAKPAAKPITKPKAPRRARAAAPELASQS